MNKLTIIGISIIVLAIAVFLGNYVDECPSLDGYTLHWAYCNHMGYERKITGDNVGKEEGLVCIFPDGSNCTSYSFWSGNCGQDKVRDILDRKLCEKVYLDFEKCEEGLVPSERKYILEQEHCRKPNLWETFFLRRI